MNYKMKYDKKIGIGSWHIGDSKEKEKQEIEALQKGIESGITLIDTAEMYGEGKSEILVGKAIAPFKREELYLVSKVYPHNAGKDKIFNSCKNSLKRLCTGYLDLYLLHWRGSVPLEETVSCMEKLKKDGLIRAWGVSNFDRCDMEELIEVENGENCECNQVLYHLASRGIEYSLLPYMAEKKIDIMAYSPLAQAGGLEKSILKSKIIKNIAEKNGLSIYQILLAFSTKRDGIIAIPKSGSPEHSLENAKVLGFELSEEDYETLSSAFPAPNVETGLDII